MTKTSDKIPGRGAWILHQMKCLKWNTLSLRAKIGLLMLFLNVPVGWGGGALCIALAARYKSAVWGIAGPVIYVISWAMIPLGILLCGKPLFAKIKRNKRIVTAAWKRLLAIRTRP